jgi:hypothetical protein
MSNLGLMGAILDEPDYHKHIRRIKRVGGL